MELQVANERYLWIQILYKEALPPARVCNDQLRNKGQPGCLLTFGESAKRLHTSFAADHLGFKLGCKRVNACCRAPFRVVLVDDHAIELLGRDAQTMNFVASLRKCRCQIAELTRKILVNE